MAEEDWPTLIDLIVNTSTTSRIPAVTDYLPTQSISQETEAATHCSWEETDLSVSNNKSPLCPVLINSQFRDPIDEARTMESLKKISEQLDQMDQKIYRLLEREREKNRDKVNRKITVSNLQYQPGEYVLVSSKGTSRRRNKLKLYWTGPWIITGVPGHNIYEVRDPLGNAKTVHSSRVRFYDGKNFR